MTDEERLANVVRAERGILATNWWETLTIAFNLTFFAEDFPMMVPIMLAVGNVLSRSGPFLLSDGPGAGEGGCGREKACGLPAGEEQPGVW